MKKTALSIVAVVALSGMANAKSSNELATLKAQMAQMAQKIEALEAAKATAGESEVATTDDIAGIETQITGLKNDMKKGVQVKSHVPEIEIGGKDYLGFVSSKADNSKRTNKFETRRNYIDLKGFFAENPKDYVRATLDVYQTSGGSWDTKLKYAYLYLDDILPYTGVELGMVHRPWIDYEESNAWLYRSISKVLVEDNTHGANFASSADLGANFKTKTPYFSSEVGLFNGAGYDKKEDGAGLSGEWRLTAHLLGTGKEKVNKDLQYANISFFGERSQKDNTRGNTNGDFNWYGVHAVYNQPEFLIAAQYVKTQDAIASMVGKGYEVNSEYRFMPDWSLLGMYTKYKYDNGTDKDGKLAGIAYDYNKNVKFIVNYLGETDAANKDTKSIMGTAEINW